MAKNTGRGSRVIHQSHTSLEWVDTSRQPFVVWAELDEDAVVIYEGEKEGARRRHVFTAEEAEEMAALLRDAARVVRRQ